MLPCFAGLGAHRWVTQGKCVAQLALHSLEYMNAHKHIHMETSSDGLQARDQASFKLINTN